MLSDRFHSHYHICLGLLMNARDLWRVPSMYPMVVEHRNNRPQTHYVCRLYPTHNLDHVRLPTQKKRKILTLALVRHL